MKKVLKQLIKEANLLHKKKGKLDAFIHCDDYSDLEDEMQFLLDMQLTVMNGYLTILDKRIDLIRQDVELKRNKDGLTTEYKPTKTCCSCLHLNSSIGAEIGDFSPCLACKEYSNWSQR